MKRHTVFVGITAGTLLVLSATATVVAFNALFEDSTNMGQAQLSSLKPATESVRQQLPTLKPVASPSPSVVIKVQPTPTALAPISKNNPDTSVSSDNNAVTDSPPVVDNVPVPPIQPPSDDISEPTPAPTIEPNDNSKNVSDDSIPDDSKSKGEPQNQDKEDPKDD